MLEKVSAAMQLVLFHGHVNVTKSLKILSFSSNIELLKFEFLDFMY